MKSAVRGSDAIDLNHQGAQALLTSTFDFLRRNRISSQYILDFAANYPRNRPIKARHKLLSDLICAHEYMGVVMATWFSDPRFLDKAGNPLPLDKQGSPKSIANLVRVSKTRLSFKLAMKLMAQSPSIKFCKDGTILAVKRVFVLPKLEVPRAAFVVDRYLKTLQLNAKARFASSPLLLERSCHASEVNLAKIAPLLRDIEGRGTAFMDSIDGEIENRRIRRSTQKNIGEMGVLVFAWTVPSQTPKKKRSPHNSVQPTKSKLNAAR